jgi:hypothetical protein
MNANIRKYLARHVDVTTAAYTAQLAAKVTTCTNELSDTALASMPMTNIPVFLVNARLNGNRFEYPKSKADSLIKAMNDAYRRAGFSFSLARQMTASFASLNDVSCNMEDIGQCGRCVWYNDTLPAEFRNPRVLVVYLTECDESVTLEGQAVSPYNMYQGNNLLACTDGIFINTVPGTIGGITDAAGALARDAATTIHEVRFQCGVLHGFSRSRL